MLDYEGQSIKEIYYLEIRSHCPRPHWRNSTIAFPTIYRKEAAAAAVIMEGRSHGSTAAPPHGLRDNRSNNNVLLVSVCWRRNCYHISLFWIFFNIWWRRLENTKNKKTWRKENGLSKRKTTRRSEVSFKTQNYLVVFLQRDLFLFFLFLIFNFDFDHKYPFVTWFHHYPCFSLLFFLSLGDVK